MRRFISLLLSIVMVISFAGCKKKKTVQDPNAIVAQQWAIAIDYGYNIIDSVFEDVELQDNDAIGNFSIGDNEYNIRTFSTDLTENEDDSGHFKLSFERKGFTYDVYSNAPNVEETEPEFDENGESIHVQIPERDPDKIYFTYGFNKNLYAMQSFCATRDLAVTADHIPDTDAIKFYGGIYIGMKLNEIPDEIKPWKTDSRVVSNIILDGLALRGSISDSYDADIYIGATKNCALILVVRDNVVQSALLFGSVNIQNSNDSEAETTDTTEPTVTEPVETEPVETEPVETNPVETNPIEIEPIGTEPVIEDIDEEKIAYYEGYVNSEDFGIEEGCSELISTIRHDDGRTIELQMISDATSFQTTAENYIFQFYTDEEFEYIYLKTDVPDEEAGGMKHVEQFLKCAISDHNDSTTAILSQSTMLHKEDITEIKYIGDTHLDGTPYDYIKITQVNGTENTQVINAYVDQETHQIHSFNTIEENVTTDTNGNERISTKYTTTTIVPEINMMEIQGLDIDTVHSSDFGDAILSAKMTMAFMMS